MPPEGRTSRFLGAGPAIFSTWLLMLLLALRVQRTLQPPLIPIPPNAGKSLTFVFLIGWIFGVAWAMLSLPRRAGLATGPLLVTTGPFAVVRHPFYAISLFFLGLVTIVSSRSWVVAAVWPLSYLQARIWVRLFEERSLESAFGGAWRAYAAHTPLFFPRLLRAREARERLGGSGMPQRAGGSTTDGGARERGTPEPGPGLAARPPQD